MTPLSRPSHYGVFAALVLLMTATRFHHLGDALHLPDASMAVFFLGGLYLRRHGAFVVFLLMAVTIDWVAITARGLSFWQHYCVTPSYAFLLLAYAVLWYGGRAYAARSHGRALRIVLAGALATGMAAAAVSFLISNGAFYWLGGRYAEPNVAEYLSRLWQWGPPFVRTTTFYVAVGLAVHGLLAWRLRVSATQRTAAA